MFSDDDFDFGALLDDDFLTSGCVLTAMGLCTNPSEKGRPKPKLTIVKSVNGAESVLRMRRKIFRPKDGQIDNNAAVNSMLCRQYLRRRSTVSSSRAFKLYAFPTFDKCDSLLFIPTTIASLCNSGDWPALSKLLHSRAAKNCRVHIDVLSNNDMSPETFVTMQRLIADVHPDIILCVHTTRVIGNQIFSSAVIKFTASTALHKAMARTRKDPTFDPLFSVERAESLRHMIQREDIPEHERGLFRAQLDTDLDLVVHKKTEMVLTFDDTTKKLSRLSMKCRLTAIEVMPRQIETVE